MITNTFVTLWIYKGNYKFIDKYVIKTLITHAFEINIFTAYKVENEKHFASLFRNYLINSKRQAKLWDHCRIVT